MNHSCRTSSFWNSPPPYNLSGFSLDLHWHHSLCVCVVWRHSVCVVWRHSVCVVWRHSVCVWSDVTVCVWSDVTVCGWSDVTQCVCGLTSQCVGVVWRHSVWVVWRHSVCVVWLCSVWVLCFAHLAATAILHIKGHLILMRIKTNFKKTNMQGMWELDFWKNVFDIFYLVSNIFPDFFQAKTFSKILAPIFPVYWSLLDLHWFSSKSNDVWYAKWPLPLR